MLSLVLTLCACSPEVTPPPLQEVAVASEPGPPEPPPPPSKPALELTEVRGAAHRSEVASHDAHPLTVWSKRGDEVRGAFLLLHGRTWSGLPDFDLQVEGEHLSLMDRLQEAGYAAYALDLRGYGGTPRDASGWNNPEKATKDTLAAMAWIAEREGFAAVVFGWSYGSITAHIAAQREPELAQALVLYGWPRHPRGRSKVLPDPPAPDRARNSRHGAKTDFITRGTISDLAVNTYAKACYEADPIRVDWYRVHEFDEADPRKLTVPTLVIHGDGDPVAHPKHQQLTIEYLTVPKGHAIIPNADHAAHLEHPAPFVMELLAFTSQFDPSQP